MALAFFCSKFTIISWTVFFLHILLSSRVFRGSGCCKCAAVADVQTYFCCCSLFVFGRWLSYIRFHQSREWALKMSLGLAGKAAWPKFWKNWIFLTSWGKPWPLVMWSYTRGLAQLQVLQNRYIERKSECHVKIQVQNSISMRLQFALPMPVSPSCVSGISAGHFPTLSCVSGISACHFPICQSSDKLWIFLVRPATFKYGQAVQSKTMKTPSTLQAYSFFLMLSWNLAPWPPRFLRSSCSTCLSQHLTHWKFQSIALEPEILWKRWFARTFAWAIHVHFFSCYSIFT